MRQLKHPDHRRAGLCARLISVDTEADPTFQAYFVKIAPYSLR
jgi:hypothetical protein